MEKAPDLNGRYTYADYKTWPEDFRCELIDGEIVMLAAPAPYHQFIVGALYGKLLGLLIGKPCSPAVAPYDVPLGVSHAEKNRAQIVVQPDIVVWCRDDKEKPKIVVEVLSPSTSLKDLNLKKELYLENGIPEYWVVSPERRMITRFALEDGAYLQHDQDRGEFSSRVLEGVAFDVEALFAVADELVKNAPNM